MPGMAIALSIFGVVCAAFAAFFIWLMVRIINRRERWAKWTAVLLAPALISPVLYVLSFGLVEWLVNHGWLPASTHELIELLYCPLGWVHDCGPKPIAGSLEWYSELWDD
jgi:H+/Cl- antiporter ClcA